MIEEKVTVIICCFNEGKLLINAINSLKKQSYKNFEVLLINDGSSDAATNLICKSLLKESNIKVIWHKENLGLSSARNTAFAHSNTEIIIPLDADDELPTNAIEKIVNGFKMYPDADFIFGNYMIIDESNKINLINCSNIVNNDCLLNPTSISKNWSLLGTSPCRKQVWEQIGGYDPKFANSIQDIDFWIRAIMNNNKGYYINDTIYFWKIRKIGMNNNVKSIFHIHNLYKNRKFFSKYGDLKKNKEIINFVFLSYYGKNYYYDALKVALLHLPLLNNYSKLRIVIILFKIIKHKTIFRNFFKINK